MSEGPPSELLELTGVTRAFGRVRAVDGLSLSLREGEFVTLLGPSGCGKTTVLRLIAGFEQPDEGSIRFRGEEIAGVSPQRRGFGMVFQSYALFPHLNVFENVAFGLRARGTPAPGREARVRAALAIVDLSAYETRTVQALSGGQQQRVALARALAIEPPLLLLDEPLSNLDQALRIQTRNDIRRLVLELGITALFVTHDQEEAFDLSDRIAVMSEGRIHQVGSPRQLYEEPADRFVAGFVGRANALTARRTPAGLRLLGGGAEWSWVPGDTARGRAGRVDPGEACVLLVRPEDLEFVGDEEVNGRGCRGSVRDRRYRGGTVSYSVALAGGGEAERGGGAVVEIVGPPEGPRVGEGVRVAPRRGARLHVFPGEPRS